MQHRYYECLGTNEKINEAYKHPKEPEKEEKRHSTHRPHLICLLYTKPALEYDAKPVPELNTEITAHILSLLKPTKQTVARNSYRPKQRTSTESAVQ